MFLGKREGYIKLYQIQSNLHYTGNIIEESYQSSYMSTGRRGIERENIQWMPIKIKGRSMKVGIIER